MPSRPESELDVVAVDAPEATAIDPHVPGSVVCEPAPTEPEPPPGWLRAADCLLADRRTWIDPGFPSIVDGSDVPVIVVGSADPSAIAAALEADAAEYLPRTLLENRPALVAERVEAVVERRRGAYRPVIDAVDEPISVHSSETGELLEANRAFRKLIDAGDGPEPSFADVLTSDGTEVPGVIADTGPDERATVEWRIDRPDGDTAWIESRLETATIDGERVVIASSADVTDRRAESAAFERMLDETGTPVSVHDPETGAVREASASLADLLGLDSRAELVDVGLDGFPAREEAADELRDRVERVHEARSLETVEWSARRDEGRALFRIVLSPAEVRNRRSVIAVWEDITEQRRLEREYEQIFNGVDDIIAVRDPETGRLIDANQSYADLLGYDPEEMIGTTLGELVGSDGDDGPSFVEQVAAADEPIERDWEIVDAEGTRRVIDVTATTTTVGGEERYLAIGREVTERHERERAVEALGDATGRMQDAETPEEVSNVALTAVKEVLDLPLAVCWLHDPENDRLDPVAATDEVHEQVLVSSLGPERREYQVFREGAVTRYDPGDDGAGLIDSGVLLPLGDHGLVVAGREDEIRYDEVVLEVARALADHATTALDRVERAREVRENERRLRGILDRIDEAIQLAEPPDLTEPLLSSGYDEIWGRDRESVGGAEGGFYDTLHPDDAPRHREFIEGMIADVEAGDPADRYSREYRIERPDGEFRWVHSSYYPTEWDGDPRLVIVSRDVTERKRRENAVRALQRATEGIQDAGTPEAVAETTVAAASDVLELPAAICWFHDPEAERLDPVAATDPVVDADLVSPLDAERHEYDVFLDGEATSYAPSEHGEENPLETGVLLPLGEHGLLAAGRREGGVDDDEVVLEVARALADHATTALDRVERAREVRENERRFRLIADRIDEVIFLATGDLSEVLYVNPAYEDVWGRPIAHLYDDPTSWMGSVDPRDREAFEADIEGIVEDIDRGTADERYSLEYRIRRPDGDVRWLSGTVYPVEIDGGERRFIGITEDVTDRKRREQRLEVFNRVLRHNLRNQLDVVKSHAEVLLDVADAPGDEHARRIIAAADSLAAMGNRAREIDRIMSREDREEVIDLRERLAETIEGIDSHDTEVDVDLDLPEEYRLVTDGEALSAVLRSALENAVAYADSEVEVSVGETADGCTVTVADDGPGIPANELASLRAGTETDLQHGRGLGLWQLKWAVEKLNGELRFDTGPGTVVRVAVPDREGLADGG